MWIEKSMCNNPLMLLKKGYLGDKNSKVNENPLSKREISGMEMAKTNFL